MTRPDAWWLMPGGLLVLGGAAAGVGLLVRGPLAAGAAEERAALRSAPLVDARSLSTLAPGTRVLAQGRIATTTEAPHGLVAFIGQQYEGTEQSAPNRGRQRWRELERHTPALELDIDGQRLSIEAGEYALESPPHDRAPEGGPVASTQRLDLGLAGLSTRRVRGFAAGDAITVDGAVAVAAGGTRSLRAQRLYGGDVAAYRDERDASIRTLPMIGTVLTAIGLGVLALGSTLLWRALRTRRATRGERP